MGQGKVEFIRVGLGEFGNSEQGVRTEQVSKAPVAEIISMGSQAPVEKVPIWPHPAPSVVAWVGEMVSILVHEPQPCWAEGAGHGGDWGEEGFHMGRVGSGMIGSLVVESEPRWVEEGICMREGGRSDGRELHRVSDQICKYSKNDDSQFLTGEVSYK